MKRCCKADEMGLSERTSISSPALSRLESQQERIVKKKLETLKTWRTV